MPESLILDNASQSASSVGFSTLGGLMAIAPEEQERLRIQVARELSPRYEAEAMLGYGAFATVWRVRDTVTGERLAAKRFQGSLSSGAGFYRELNALFRLDHPNVVRIVNLLEISPKLRYLFLEHCEGGTLRQAMRDQRKLGRACEPRVVAEIGRQIANGLATAHRLNFIHRDLKPENILFASRPISAESPCPIDEGRGPLKIVDFGLAQALSRPARGGGRLAALSGTPLYMAPERFHGEAGRPGDIYPLGLILFELLHGRPTFEGSPESLARQHIQASPRFSDELPVDWRTLLEEALAKDPTQRPDAGSLANRLAALTPPPEPPVNRIATILPNVAEKQAPPPVREIPAPPVVDDDTVRFDRCPGMEIVALQAAPDGDGFLVATHAGLFHYRPGQSRRPEFRATPSIKTLRRDHDGHPLLIDVEGNLWRVSPDSPEPTLHHKSAGPIDDCVACEDGRIVAASGGTLRILSLFGIVAETFPIPYGRSPERILPLAGNRIALTIATAAGHSRCLIIEVGAPGGAGARVSQSLDLPGPCLGLAASGDGLVAAVRGDSVDQLLQIRRDEQTITPVDLDGDIPVDFGRFGNDPRSTLYGITPRGELLQWQVDGRLARTGSADFREGERKALAWSPRHAAAWIRSGSTDWLSVRSLPPPSPSATRHP